MYLKEFVLVCEQARQLNIKDNILNSVLSLICFHFGVPLNFVEVLLHNLTSDLQDLTYQNFLLPLLEEEFEDDDDLDINFELVFEVLPIIHYIVNNYSSDLERLFVLYFHPMFSGQIIDDLEIKGEFEKIREKILFFVHEAIKRVSLDSDLELPHIAKSLENFFFLYFTAMVYYEPEIFTN